jgi:spermidine synthase
MTDSSPADSARRSARPQQHRLSLPITSRGLLISLLFLLSGVSALVYQVVWVRQLTTVFGATIYAVSTVLTAFMGGLALGSWLVGKRADMMKRPLVAFGVLEILTAAAAFGFPYVLDWVTPVIGWAYSTGGDASFYSFSLLRFGLIGGLLLVPTTLMGATLPVLSRAVVRDLESIGHRVGGLYAVNTLGAMLGAFLTGFVLLERFGIWHTTVLAVINDAVVGLLAILIGWGMVRAVDVSPAVEQPRRVLTRAARYVLLTYGVSGLIALSLQVAWSRSLIFGFEHLKATTFAFSSILTIFLLGLAVGSALMQAVVDKIRQPLAAYGFLQILLGLSSGLSLFLIMTDLPDWMLRPEIADDGSGNLNTWFAIGNVMTRTAVVIGLPTLLMGMLFPVAARIVSGNVQEVGADIGRLYAINTAGAIVGSFLGGFILIPLVGISITLAILAAASLAIGIGALALSPVLSGPRRGMLVGVCSVVAAVFVVRIVMGPGAGSFQRLLEDDKLVFYKEGPLATVSVVEDLKGWRTIYVDGVGVAGTDPVIQTDQKTLAHVPMMLLGGEAESVLTVGFGAGGASHSYTLYPDINNIHACEITTTVPSAAITLTEANHGIVLTDAALKRELQRLGPDGVLPHGVKPLSAYTHRAGPGYVTHDPRYRLVIDDARAYLRFTGVEYDVIATDCTDLRYKSNANLYDREYFQLCRERISERGLVVVWVPLAGLSDEAFRIMTRTFHDVFPQMQVWYFTNQPTHYCLFIAGRDEVRIDMEAVIRATQIPGIQGDLVDIGLSDPAKVVASFVTDDRALDVYLGDGPLNTEDFPILEFLAPRHGYDARPIAVNMGRLFDNQVPVLPLVDMSPVLRREYADRIDRYQRANPILFEGHVEYRDHNVVRATERYLQAREIAGEDPSIDLLLEFDEVRLVLDSGNEIGGGLRSGQVMRGSPWLAFQLGRSYLLQQRYEDAVSIVMPYLRNIPDAARATEEQASLGHALAMIVARCYKAIGNDARAMEYLERAKAYAPEREDWGEVEREFGEG